jgi:hypothetical protein
LYDQFADRAKRGTDFEPKLLQIGRSLGGGVRSSKVIGGDATFC